MKKIFNNLVLIVLFLVPVVVKADMSAPMVPRYEVRVINKNGANLYDYSDGNFIVVETIDYGAIIDEIDYEEEFNGETYFSYDNYYIKAADVAPVDQIISPDSYEYSKLDTPWKVRVYADEIILRTGPGVIFNKVATIKKGSIGKLTHIEENYYYVEFDGQKGWVDSLGRTILYNSEDVFVVFVDLETKCGTIPANTIFTSSWEGSIWDSANFYEDGGATLVNYNNCETFINTFKSSNRYFLDKSGTDYGVTSEETKVYDTIDGKKIVGTIPKGALLPIVFRATDDIEDYIFYIIYNDIKGWINADDVDFIHYDNSNYDLETHEKSNKILSDYLKSVYGENYNKYPLPIKSRSPESKPVPIVEPIPDETEKKPEETTNKKSGMNSRDILIACCIGAFGIALGAVATIIILNKKKNTTNTNEDISSTNNDEINKE